MFKRTFKVVYNSVKHNFLLLPENYFNIVSTYDTGCLSIQYNGRTHYMSWAPQAEFIKETEIGINAKVAKEIGLKDDDLIKCQLVADVLVLRTVFVTPASTKDWDIIEMSSDKIAEIVLQQARIINSNQKLIIWINKSIQVTLTIDRLKPNLSYGRLDHTTELIVTPIISKALDINAFNSKTSYNGRNGLMHSQTVTHYDNLYNNKQECTQKDGKYLERSATMFDITSPSQNHSQTKRQVQMIQMKKELMYEMVRIYEFRVISGIWQTKKQISDIFINDRQQYRTYPGYRIDINALYCMQTFDNNEYYVRLIRMKNDDNADNDIDDNDDTVDTDDVIPCTTLYPTIQVNFNLMKLLNFKELERVVLKQKPIIKNFVEKIELFAHKKTHYKLIESAFKRFIVETCAHRNGLVLLNQNEVIRLDENLIVTVNIVPEHFRYCIIDMEFLKDSKLYAADAVRNVDDIITAMANVERPLSVRDLIKLPKFEKIIKRLVCEINTSMCLNTSNFILRQNNILIAGSSGIGKSVLIEQILDQLIRKPYYCYFDIFYCTRSKGRKIESIQKDLRSLFTICLKNSPSILVMENIDVLAYASSTNVTQDGEYFNRLADIIHQLIVQYTSSESIVVIATVTDIQTLNRRLYAPRGSYIFQIVIKLPNLEFADRVQILSSLCSHIATRKLDIKKFALLTEGYNQRDLVEFVERAIFYAYRLNKVQPLLTNQHLCSSLNKTNTYCLHGIESHQNFMGNDISNDIDEIRIENIPGLQMEVSVLEEVIRWPCKYPKIFNMSPLRNQSGILLYGPPGTGKTMLVSRMALCWNLRIISIKGPELLAKYIGQSEENVRNIFNRARTAQPCVLFFDEFDSLAPKRGHDATGVTDRVVNQLLTELDGVESLQGVTVIAATSRPELLDPALLRSGRIDRLVEFPLPDKLARLGIFKLLSNSLNLDKSVDFEIFASKTENYTGADIHSVVTSANMIAVKEALNCESYGVLPDMVVVKQEHFLEACSTTRPTLTVADIAKYRRTYAKFTNKEKCFTERVSKRATLA